MINVKSVLLFLFLVNYTQSIPGNPYRANHKCYDEERNFFRSYISNTTRDTVFINHMLLYFNLSQPTYLDVIREKIRFFCTNITRT